jgi:excinuclease ABC subunit A
MQHAHGDSLYTTAVQLDGLVESGNTVIVVEHDMRVVAGSDWVIDIGPGAGEEGGRVVVAGPPSTVAKAAGRTAPYLARFLGEPAGRYHQKS